jgi:hypothetical protein
MIGANMDGKDKKHYRQIKRDIKRAGTKRLRQQLKNDLADHPEEAHWDEVDHAELSSKGMNGLDQDSTRKPRGKS